MGKYILLILSSVAPNLLWRYSAIYNVELEDPEAALDELKRRVETA